MVQDDEGRHGIERAQEVEFLADTLDELLDRLSFISDQSSRETKVKIRKLIADVREKLANGHQDIPVGVAPGVRE